MADSSETGAGKGKGLWGVTRAFVENSGSIRNSLGRLLEPNTLLRWPSRVPAFLSFRRSGYGPIASFALLATIGCAPTAHDGSGAAYVDDANFRQEVFESTLPVLVDFTATWSVPCREVDLIVDELASEMAGKAKVVKLDIDDSPEIHEQLRVDAVPTVMFLNEGQEVDRIGGLQEREIYVQYLTAMIEGRDMLETRLTMLQHDEYRKHFIVSRELAGIEAILPHRPDLLVEPFADGGTPLSAAIKRSSVHQKALIELILSHDPVIGLHDLLGIGRCDEFLVAVEPDYDVANVPDPDGATPLWLGLMGNVRERDDHCARALLEAGAQPISSSTYYLPQAVIFYEDPELLREFLDYGMDPRETDEQGMNALHLAAMYGYYPLVEVLLEYGMEPATVNGRGETAVEMVRSEQHRREELRNERGMLDTPEQRAAFREYEEESNKLLALLEGAQT